MKNTNFNTYPAVIHGNGISKITFNSYTNYIPNKWSPESGCATCYDNSIDLSTVKVLLPKTFLLIIHLQTTICKNLYILGRKLSKSAVIYNC